VRLVAGVHGADALDEAWALLRLRWKDAEGPAIIRLRLPDHGGQGRIVGWAERVGGVTQDLSLLLHCASALHGIGIQRRDGDWWGPAERNLGGLQLRHVSPGCHLLGIQLSLPTGFEDLFRRLVELDLALLVCHFSAPWANAV
jgi:hypothetical protein